MTIAQMGRAVRHDTNYAFIVWCCIGVFAGSVASLLTPSTFSSTATLYVTATVRGDPASAPYEGALLIQKRLPSYIQIAESERASADAASLLGLNLDTANVAGRTHASSPLNSNIITITVEDPSPARAQILAGGIAKSLISIVADLENGTATDGAPDPVRMEILSEPTFDDEPITPQPFNNSVTGLAGGVLLALVSTFIGRFRRGRVDRPEAVIEILSRRALVELHDGQSSLSPVQLSHFDPMMFPSGPGRRPAPVIAVLNVADTDGPNTVPAVIADGMARCGWTTDLFVFSPPSEPRPGGRRSETHDASGTAGPRIHIGANRGQPSLAQLTHSRATSDIVVIEFPPIDSRTDGQGNLLSHVTVALLVCRHRRSQSHALRQAVYYLKAKVHARIDVVYLWGSTTSVESDPPTGNRADSSRTERKIDVVR